MPMNKHIADTFFRLQLLDWPRFVPWLLSGVLLVSIGILQLGWLRPLQQTVSSQQAQIAELPSVVPLKPLPAVSAITNPVATTLAQFPDLKQAPEALGKLDEIAGKHGLLLDKQTFDWTDEADLALTRLEFTLGLKVDEARLHAFLSEAKAALPTLTVLHTSFKRDSSRSPQVDTELRLAVYFHRTT